MTIEQAAAKLRAREVSAVELAQESLSHIREQQPRLNAFITVTEELAFQQARQADEDFSHGVDVGPLQGIPYSLKDIFMTKGIRTTYGSKIFEHYVPDVDSAVYEKLTKAGAVLMGKNSMHELAFGLTSDNPHFGTVRNPRNPACIPGGSSGGSAAAVTSGQVFFSIGSDSGGSIRVPAAFCGCTGLKPTSGRVSRYGGLPIDFSLDHIGPFTRTVRDAALVMNAIAGFDERDDTSSMEPVGDDSLPSKSTLAGFRIGVAENFFNERVSPGVTTAFEDALKRAEQGGGRLVTVRVPDPTEINIIGRLILNVEAAAPMEPYMHRRGDFGKDVLRLFDQGRLISGADYINAQRLRRIYQKRWAKLWEQIDVLLTPAVAVEAPLIGQTSVGGEDFRQASTRLSRPFNVLGWPAVSIPSNTADLPAGLQIAGRPFEENKILGVANQLSLPFVPVN